jgi:hypothetical protein
MMSGVLVIYDIADQVMTRAQAGITRCVTKPVSEPGAIGG